MPGAMVGLRELPVPPPGAPMLATLTRALPHGDRLYEPKWDGFRCVAFRAGDRTLFLSRKSGRSTATSPSSSTGCCDSLSNASWRSSFAQTIDTICTPDVLIHTWDLARATGLDEALDPDEVHRFADGIDPLDEILWASGHYGPRTPVADDADEQTWLLAFLGRRP